MKNSEKNNNVCLFTVEKTKKNESKQKQDRQDSINLLDTVFSKVRQPIESLFT